VNALPRAGGVRLSRAFHPFTTNELPQILARSGITSRSPAWTGHRHLAPAVATLWALWLASRGHPSGRLFSIFVAGTVLMRSAGCAINDYADRSFDPHVKRTRSGHWPPAASPPSRRWSCSPACRSPPSPRAAVDKTTLLYAVAGAALAVTYPFIKRFLSVPQLYLGITSAGEYRWHSPRSSRRAAVGWLLLLANVLWVTVYDTMYAMVDRDDDVAIGVRSTAILFATPTAHSCAAAGDDAAGPVSRRADHAAGHLVPRGIDRGRHLLPASPLAHPPPGAAGVLQAFLNNNYFGMCIFLGIASTINSHREEYPRIG